MKKDKKDRQAIGKNTYRPPSEDYEAILQHQAFINSLSPDQVADKFEVMLVSPAEFNLSLLQIQVTGNL